MPPKRVAIACKFCRSRKRKCDGKQPICTACQNLERECVYEETDRVDPAKRLENIESLLQAHTDAIAELSKSLARETVDSSPAPRWSTRENNRPYSHRRDPSDGPRNSFPFDPAVDHAPEPVSTPTDNSTLPLFNIPFGHRATTSSLLVLPQVRMMVGEFPQDTFFRLEARRPPLADPLVNIPPVMDRIISDDLLERFFELVYPYHSLFEREEFMELYQRVIDRGLQENAETALVLAVLALGAIASEPKPAGEIKEDDMAGFEYYNAASRILVAAWAQSFGGNIMLTQGLVLSALYLLYLMRPLQAWRLIHMASTSIQQTLIGSEKLSESQQESITRVCWSCFLIECDNLAEFDHPRSGIEPLVDKLPFPSCSPPHLDLQRYLANLSIRCLLNRIHHCLYFSNDTPIAASSPMTPQSHPLSPSHHNPNPSLTRICSELNHQLENWYAMLPDAIRPLLDPQSSNGVHSLLLQLRYWSAKQFIYRPYVIYLLSKPSNETLSQDTFRACQICLHACRRYIYTCADFLSTNSPSAYTYMGAQCCLGSILVLTLARSCPALEHFVSDIDELQSLAIQSLGLWSSPGSSVQCAYEIAISVRTKLRLRT
ncbi:uncharacterized protein BDV14DRAFT_195347 [Aspergillus stella-maris]|uniref:uncharacterized protein n=1 Tax=Aspergillus stella-maris TaxID=1810926 RepID=UPI003CCDE198